MQLPNTLRRSPRPQHLLVLIYKTKNIIKTPFLYLSQEWNNKVFI